MNRPHDWADTGEPVTQRHEDRRSLEGHVRKTEARYQRLGCGLFLLWDRLNARLKVSRPAFETADDPQVSKHPGTDGRG